MGSTKRAEAVNHLEQYASSFGAPVRFGVTVTAVDPAPGGGGYLVSTAGGDTFAAANVVVATGSFQFPEPTKLRSYPELTALTEGAEGWMV